MARPWNFNPKKEEQEGAAPEVIPFEPKPDEEREPELVSKYVPRGVKMTKAEIAEYGYTKGCRKCEFMRRGDASHPSLGHSQECRQRIEAEMRRGNSQRKRRMEEADQRINTSRGRSRNRTGQRKEFAVTGHQRHRVPRHSHHPLWLHQWAHRRRHPAELQRTCRPTERERERLTRTWTRAACVSTRRDDRGTKRDREEDAQVDVNVVQKVERNLHDHMVRELFTTPRMTLCAFRAGLMSGWSIDHLITDPITGAKWDGNRQKRILKKVEMEKPYMIFMAPLKDTISISTAVR